MTGGWDWRKMLPNDVAGELALCNYPGWDKLEDGSVPFVQMEIAPLDKSSRAIAKEWDDIGRWQFVYRDWTKSGLPSNYGETSGRDSGSKAKTRPKRL